MLEVTELSCGYGDIVAARDISFTVMPGEVLALIGANGAGKSSILMCLVGLVDRLQGSIKIDGKEIGGLDPEQRVRHGIAVVPEGRRIFSDLSVAENLTVGGQTSDRVALERKREQVYQYFPRLRDRNQQLAGSLSGGEQQMLAIGRALMSQPRVLLVDEMSLGLMPKMVDECYAVLEGLKNTGVATVLVEQNTERAIEVADQVLVVEAGNILWQGSVDDLSRTPEVVDNLLSTSGLS